jgi:hypothetical protein
MRRKVCPEGGADFIEHFRVDAFRIIGRLDEIGAERADEHGFSEPLGAVPAHVPGNLAGAHGVTDKRDAVEIQALSRASRSAAKVS